MAIPKRKPVISKQLAGDIGAIAGIKELKAYWDDLSIYSEQVEELKVLYKKHDFDSCTMMLAYLWSTKDFDIEQSYRVYIESWVNGTYKMMYIKKEAPRELTSSKNKAKVFTKADAMLKVSQLENAELNAFKEEIKGE